MKKHTTSTVYLIHLLRPLGNPNNPRGMASHYLGFAEHDLAARLERHHAGNGSRLMGRDHHPRAFTIWMAGGGVKPGITVGRTDDLGYNVVEDPVDVHDLHATILHLMGLDHTKLTYKFQGREFRLTDVSGTLVTKLLA